MPTGLTAPVIDGKITTLDEFARECSSQFVWSAREGRGLAYPRRDTYSMEGLKKAVADLEAWDSGSEEYRYGLWSEYAEGVIKRGEESQAESRAAAARLTPILEAARKVEVPETHANFKKFMIEQLESTLEWDGTFRPDYHTFSSYEEWTASQRSEILRRIERYTTSIREDEEKYQKSVEWIDTLASLFNLEIDRES